jgi:hypothetical protein
MGACWARANHDPCLDTHDAYNRPAEEVTLDEVARNFV